MTIQTGSCDPVEVSRYPFPTMEVGDSFIRILQNINELYKNNITSLHNSAYEYGKRHNMKFSIRKTTDGYKCLRLL